MFNLIDQRLSENLKLKDLLIDEECSCLIVILSFGIMELWPHLNSVFFFNWLVQVFLTGFETALLFAFPVRFEVTIRDCEHEVSAFGFLCL